MQTEVEETRQLREACLDASAYAAGNLHYCAVVRPPQSGDGILHVQINDLIVLEYIDQAPLAVITTEATLVVQSFIANITMLPRYPAIGDDVSVTVVDNDLNSSPLSLDSHRIALSANGEAGRMYSVMLLETAISSGVFTGKFSVDAVAANGNSSSPTYLESPIVNVVAGEEIIATLNDIEPFATNRSAQVTIGTPVTISLKRTLAQGTLEVEIRDLDTIKEQLLQSLSVASIYYEARLPLTITATVSWQWGSGNFELKEKTQPELAIGTFHADVHLAGPLASIPGIDQVKEGMTLTVSYTSSQMQGRSVIASTQVQSSFAGLIRATSKDVEAGWAVHVEVYDFDLNKDSSVIEFLPISVSVASSSSSLSSNDAVQTVVLRETNPASSTFTANVLTLSDGSLSASAVVEQSPGRAEVPADEKSVLIFNYKDAAPQRNVSTQVVLTSDLPLELSLTAIGGSRVVTQMEREKQREIRVGGTFEVRLVDATGNHDAHMLDQVMLSVRLSGPDDSIMCSFNGLSCTDIAKNLWGKPAQFVCKTPVSSDNAEFICDNTENAGQHASSACQKTCASFAGGSEPTDISQDLMLEETGTDTGVFVIVVELVQKRATGSASALSAVSSASSASVKLAASDGDVLTAEYGVAPNNRRVVRRIFPSVVGIPSLRGSEVAAAISYSPSLELWPFEIGSLVSLTLVDADLNEDVTAAEQTEVTVAVTSNGEVAQVSMQERGTDTSVFTGALRTRMEGPTGAELQSLLQQGVLPIAPGSVLTAVYQDAAPTKQIKSAMFARAGMLGTLQLSPAILKSGGVLTVFVRDTDLDRDSLVAERATVVLTCDANQDREILELHETSNSSGIFTAQIQTIQTVVNGKHGSGWLNIRAGASIVASYQDDAAGAMIETQAHTRASTIAELSASRRVAVGDSQLFVTVFDSDADVTSAVDFATAWLFPAEGWGLLGPKSCKMFACDPGGAMALRLVETGQTSGVFTGAFATSSTESVSNEKQCVNQAVPSVCNIDSDCLGGGLCRARHFWPGASLMMVPGTVQVVYDDVRADGHFAAMWPVVIVDGLTVRCSPTTFLAGSQVTVTLQSITDDTSDQADLAIIRAHAYTKTNADQGGDPIGIPIVLKETAGSSSLFTGILPTADRAAILPEDLGKLGIDIVPIETGEQIYLRTNNNTGRVASAKAQAQTQASITLSPAALRLGGIFSITIIDEDLRASGAKVDVAVTVFKAIDPYNPPPRGVNPAISSTVLTLTETMEAPGTFTGKIFVTDQNVTASGAVQQVKVGVNDLVVSTYQDFFPLQTISANVEVLKSVVGSLQIPKTLLAGAILTVTVTDADQNVDAIDRDRVLVEVRAQRAESFQVLSLLETDYNSGVFVGAVLTRPKSVVASASLLGGAGKGSFTEDAIKAGVPLLEVKVSADSDTLTVTFNDTAPRQSVVANLSVVQSNLGTISLSEKRIAPGSYITVTVVDADASGSEVQVHLSAPSMDKPLLLSAKASGGDKTFKAQFGVMSDQQDLESHSYKVEPFRIAGKPLQLPKLNDGEMVNVSYLDHGPEATVSSVIPICSAATVEIHPLLFALGSRALIRVCDLDMSNHEGQPVQAKVENLDRRLAVFISLSEQDLPGTFTGSVLISPSKQGPGAGVLAPGELTADKGDTIRVSFEDICPQQTATVQALAKNLGTIAISATANGVVSSNIRSGGVMSIVVEDADLNDRPLETEQVECRCWSGGSIFEHVLLVEEALDASRFTGQLLTADVFNLHSAAAPSADSVTVYTGRAEEAQRRPQDYFYPREVSRFLNPYIPAAIKPAYTASTAIQAQDDFEAVGADIICEYLDLAPHSRQVAKVHIVESHRAVFQTQPRKIVGAGGAVYVTVQDGDLVTGSPAAVVTVISQSDTLCITLTETGASTSVFTGKGLTSEDVSADDDPGLLRVQSDAMGVYETIRVQYQEEAPYLLHSFDLKVDRSHAGKIVVHPPIFGTGSVVQIAVVDADLMMGRFDEAGTLSNAGHCLLLLLVLFFYSSFFFVFPMLDTACATPQKLTACVYYIAGAIETENVNSCRSIGKHECAFPFYYKGDKYDSCTSRDEFNGNPWCSYTTQYEPSKWEYCTCQCPGCNSSAGVVHLEMLDGQTLDVYLTQAPGRSITAAQAKQDLEPNPYPPLFPPGGRDGGPKDVFTGQFSTRVRKGLGDIQGPGEILVRPGEFITFSYQDTAPEGHDKVIVKVFESTLGNLSANPWPALPGSPLSITLVDPDLYVTGSPTAENVMTQTLTLRGPSMDPDLVRNGVSGTVLLMDDGTAAGRFTATLLPLMADQVSAIQQEWPTAPSNTSMDIFPVHYDDLLLIKYYDLMPMHTVEYAIKVAMPGALEMSDLRHGGETTITIYDSDLDWDHDKIDSCTSTASIPPAQGVPVAMIETNEHSGVFTGLLSITSSALSDPFITNVTYLAGASIGSTIVATYHEREPSNVLTASRTVKSSTVATLSTDAVRGIINKRDLIAITVIDPDLNLSPLVQDTAEIVVTLHTPNYNSRNQRQETVILHETALNSNGMFTGTLQTHQGSLNAAANNGVMDVRDGDHLIVSYRDAAPARTVQKVLKVSTAGSITIIPQLVDAGKAITVQVTDYDLNDDPTAADEGHVTVLSASGDVESVSLLETALDSSIFTGMVLTSSNISAPGGTLSGVVPDSIIKATYVDKIVDTSTRTQSYTAFARVATNGSLSLLPALITQDLPVTITVTDKDQNRDSVAVETVPCQLVSLCSTESQSWDGSPLCSINPANERQLDVQNVTLIENSQSSGIFTAVIATHSENRSNLTKNYFEPSVRAPSGAIVRVQYLDRNPEPSRLRMTERRVARAGLLYAASSLINEFAPLSITLEDADLDSSDQRDTNCAPGGVEGRDLGELARTCPSPVKLIGPPGNGTMNILGYQGDGINALLYETEKNSGVFVTEIRTTSRVTNIVESSIVQAATQGSFITLTYQDQVPAALRTRRVKVASVAKVITNPDILPAGLNISITVRDADLNTNEVLQETTVITVSQTSTLPHDVRQLVLTESSLDSNMFTAILETSVDSSAAGGPSKSPIFAPAGSFLTVSVQDSNPTPATERVMVVPVSTRGVIFMQCPGNTWTACNQYDVTVTDADLNEMSNTIETNNGRVSLYNRRGEEKENLIVTENGVDSNAFLASIPVVVSRAEDCGGGGSRGDGKCGSCPDCIGADCCTLSNDNKFSISPGDMVQAVYNDFSPANYIKITRVVPTVGQVKIKSTDVRFPDNVIIGQPMLISLFDADLDESKKPTITLQSKRSSLADLETITLRSSKSAATILESYQNYGHFTGVIPSFPSHTFTSGNGVVELDRKDELSAIYTDVYPPTAPTACDPPGDTTCVKLKGDRGTCSSCAWPQYLGVISLSPYPRLLPDHVLTVTVKDYDLDKDGLPENDFEVDWSKDTSTVVSVRSCRTKRNGTQEICEPTGHVELLTLHETADAGTFTGKIQTYTRNGLAGTGVLYQAEAAGRVEVEYMDMSVRAPVTARVRVSSSAQVSFKNSEMASSAGGPVFITVVELDGETGLEDARIISVNVSRTGSLDPSTVVPLTETGGSRGVYTGALQTTHLASRESGRYRHLCPQNTLTIPAVSRGLSIVAEYLDTSTRGTNGEPSGANIVVASSLTFSSETGTIQISSLRSPLRMGDSLSITVFDQDLDVDPALPETNLTGLVVVYGNGWGCSAGAYPSCSSTAVSDGSKVFHSCQGFLASNHACLHPQSPCPKGAQGDTPLTCAQADWEEAVLSETGCSTGVFTGVLATSVAHEASSPRNGRLYVRSDPAESTKLRAVYMDSHPAGNMKDSFLGVETKGHLIAHGLDLDLSSFSIGERLTVSITDADADKDSCSVEKLTTNITVRRSGSLVDNEELTLSETGVGSGIFTAHLNTGAFFTLLASILFLCFHDSLPIFL